MLPVWIIYYTHGCKMVIFIIPEDSYRISPMVQWLRIHLPTQGTWVWSLVWEDSPCLGATKPMGRNLWARTLKPVLCNRRSRCSEEPVHRDEEKPPTAPARERLLSATKSQRSQNQTHKEPVHERSKFKNIIVHPHNKYETTEKEETLIWMCWDEKMSMRLI